MLKHIVLYKLNEEGLKNLDKIKNNFLSMRGKIDGLLSVECGADDILPALIETALTISDTTDGAFDPTLAPVLDAWGFTKDEHRVPSADELKELLSHTGCGKVALEKTADGYTVTLSGGAQLDLGGIAKGYAADLLRAQLEKEGVTSATLDLGGDVFVMGRKTDGSDWRIAVKDPADTESYLGIVSAADKFIVTSGVYERYFEENGVRYHHIIDEATLFPADYYSSLTVVIKDSALADALSTALFCMPYEDGAALAESLGAEVLWIFPDGEIRYTPGMEKLIAN